MEIYLLRHGVAEERSPDGTDAGRRLTEEGLRKLEAAEAGLRRMRLRPDALLTSPLVRARQTAAVVGRLLRLDPQVAEELAPGLDAERLALALEARPRVERIMVVGHEPDLSGLAEALAGARVELKKGALACLELEFPRDARGRLLWLLPPRALR